MEHSAEKIVHEGYIEEINSNEIKVNLLAVSACASCHARGACTASDTENKIIEVPYINGFKTGEKVKIEMKNSLGTRALVLGYVLPFFIVLSALLIASSITSSELVAGISALSVLVPYYLILFMYRKKFKKTFAFVIKKISKDIQQTETKIQN